MLRGRQGRAVRVGRVGSASPKEMLTLHLLIPRTLLIHYIINCIYFIPNINFCNKNVQEYTYNILILPLFAPKTIVSCRKFKAMAIEAEVSSASLVHRT